jgi:hypothetical protein
MCKDRKSNKTDLGKQNLEQIIDFAVKEILQEVLAGKNLCEAH